MFLSTGGLNQGYAIHGIVNATVKEELHADELERVDDFDDLYEQVEMKLIEKAVTKNAEGIINVRFEPQVVRVSVGPKYIVLHGYGTAVSLLHKKK